MRFQWPARDKQQPDDEAPAPRVPGGFDRVYYSRISSNMAPMMAQGVLTAVFCAIGLVSFLSLLMKTLDTLSIGLGFVYLAAMLTLQLGYFSRPTVVFRPSVTYPVLALQAALVYLPVLQFGESWTGVPGLLAGSLLLALRPACGVPLFALVVASMGALSLSFGDPPMTAVHLVISATITGLVTFGLTRLVRLVSQLHSARADLARLAVADERLRFSRDLHDLLGLNLSAITLKSELADRLVTEHPERAREELQEILIISRKALADARSAASGLRELSFEDECRSARSALIAADIDATIEQNGDKFTGAVGTALATVLREGVTNVLRHSKAERCEIEVHRENGSASLEIRNDGARGKRPRRRSGGNGLRNLEYRVRDLGGQLVTGTEPNGWYRLRVMVPYEPDIEAPAENETDSDAP